MFDTACPSGVGPDGGAAGPATVAGAAAAVELTVLAPGEALGCPELRRGWDARLGGVHPLNRLFASPAWFEHLWRTDPDAELWLGVARDGAGELLGVCPLAVRDVALTYDIASRVLARSTLRAAVILGGEPLLPPRPEVHRRFLDGLLERMPALHGAYISSLPQEGFAGQFLRGQGRASGQYLSYRPGGDRPWHWIELGARFDAYLGAMSSKARYNLRRQVRELGKARGGTLELVQVDSEGQVGEFLELATRVSTRSWQHRVLGPRIGATDRHRETFGDLARRGLLRAFLLRCGAEPCAFVVGYQSDGVYHYGEIGFDPALGHLSPGTTLLYLILEELFRRDTPWAFNFGIGDAAYKIRFANRTTRDASLFLLRRGLGNHLRRASHRAFDAGVVLAKRLLRRKVAP